MNLENYERLIKFIREALILLGIVFLVIYFFPLFGGIRQRLAPDNVQELTLGPISVKLKENINSFAPPSIQIEAFENAGLSLEKSTWATLNDTKQKLKSTNGMRIDVLIIVPNKTYSGKMLRDYISLLNIKFVVFQSNKLEGWIDAGSFNAQLSPEMDRPYSYYELLHEIVGASKDVVKKNTSAKMALEKMQSLHLDNLAVVDENDRFVFMANRSEILSKVVTSVVLSNK